MDYEDIIDLPHPEPQRHTRMPMMMRAAQFAPFAALTGYDAAISEASRLTDHFQEMSENRAEMLDRQIAILRESLPQHPTVTITYFRPDARKEGGAFFTATGELRHIDDAGHLLLLADGTSVPISSISDIRSVPEHP